MLRMIVTPKSSASLGMSMSVSASDLWRGMATCKSRAWIKKLDAYAFKKQKNPSVGVELRAGGDPNRSEKLGWSAGDTG